MNEQISPVDTDKISAIKGSGAMLADTFYPDLTPEIIMFPAKQMLKLFKQWQKMFLPAASEEAIKSDKELWCNPHKKNKNKKINKMLF